MQKFSSDMGPEKSISSQAACEKVKFPQDLALSGNFLYHFPKCLSSKDENGEETLKNSIALVERLQIEGLENISEVIKGSPDSGLTYPLVRTSLSTMLRNGETAGGHDNDQLIKDFHPRPLIDLSLKIHETNGFAESLELTSMLLQDGVDRSFASFFRGLLNDSKNRSNSIKLSEGLLGSDSFKTFSKLLTLEKSKVIAGSDRQILLEDWIEPKVHSLKPGPGIKLKEARDAQSFTRRYDKLIADSSQSEIDSLAKALSNIGQEFLTTTEARQQKIVDTGIDILTHLTKVQKDPVLSNFSLINLIESAKVSEFKEFIEVLEEFLETEKVPSPFHTKIAAVGIAGLIEKSFKSGLMGTDSYEGVSLESCVASHKISPVTAGVESSDDIKTVYKNLLVFLSPDKRCAGSLSPLANLVIRYIKVKIGCPDILKRPMDGSKNNCPYDEDIEILGKNLMGNSWNKILATKNINSAIYPKFIEHILSKWTEKLKRDPFSLYWLNLAYDKVEASDFEVYAKKVKLLSKDMDSLAEFDSQEQKLPLASDFIEKLSSIEVQEMQAKSLDFQGITASGKDLKLMRVLLGIYLDGPYEQMMRDNLYWEKIPASIRDQYSAGGTMAVREVLARSRMSGALFYNDSLNLEDKEIAASFFGENSKKTVNLKIFKNASGGKESFIGLDKRTSVFRRKLIYEFSDQDGYFGKVKKFFSGYGLGKDEKSSDSDELVAWFSDVLFDRHLDDKSVWIKNESYKYLKTPSDFFETSAYSVDEIREILSFYSKQFLQAPGILPEFEKDFYLNPNKNVKGQLYGIPSLQAGYAFQNHRYHFPESLKHVSGVEEIAEIIKRSIPGLSDKEYTDLLARGPFNFVDDTALGVKTITGFGKNELEFVHLLGHLGMLAQNKNKDLMIGLGLGQNCWAWNKADSKFDLSYCPINFAASPTDSGYPRLTKYLKKIALISYCPYFEDEAEVLGITDLVEDAAKWKIDSTDLAFCKKSEINLLHGAYGIFGKKKKVVFEKADRLPLGVVKKVLDDLMTMGKDPVIKDEIKAFPLHLKAFKSIKDGSVDALGFISGAKVQLSSKAAGRSHYILNSSNGFFVGPSRFANNFIGSLASNYPAVDKEDEMDPYFYQLLDRMGSEVGKVENPDRGIAYKLVKELVIKTFYELEADDKDSEKNLLDFAIIVLKKLEGKPRYQLALSRLLYSIEDKETLESMSKTIGKFIQKFDSDFSWKKRTDLYIVKQVLHSSNMRVLHEIISKFSQDEIYSFLKIVAHSMNEIEVEKRASIISRLVHLLNGQLFMQNAAGDIFGKSVQGVLLGTTRDEKIKRSLKRFLVPVLQNLSSTQTGFDGKSAPGIQKSLLQVNKFLIANGARPFEIYQRALVGEEDHLFKLLDFYMDIIEDHQDDEESLKQLSQILEHPDFVSFDKGILPILRNSTYRSFLVGSMDFLKLLDRKIIRNFLLESQKLLTKTHNMLKFLVTKIVWGEDTSIDVSYGMKGILRISDPSEDYLKRNVDIGVYWADSWISKGVVND
ncbi:MAG: hypothetical protein HOE90_24105 [Bacteriovoracaceae bacterium]|jgi:hypothetical protein|nr:hypothetical protein [Bacteriovoracaceae bacterium]